MSIDLSEVVNSEDLAAEEYTILRGPGRWLNGVWQSNAMPMPGFGSVTLANARDLEMIPEGDVVHGAMVFHSETPLYGTHGDSTRSGASSDVILWNNLYWRVLTVVPYGKFGFFRAVATRISASGQKPGNPGTTPF